MNNESNSNSATVTRYYFYKAGFVVITVVATELVEAIGKAKLLGVDTVHYDAITTVYQPEPRTIGEKLDDTLDSSKTNLQIAGRAIRHLGAGILKKISSGTSKAAVFVQPQPPVIS